MTFDAYLRAIHELYARSERRLELRKPASAAKLKQVEKAWGHALPPPLRAAWQTTDGTSTVMFARPKYLTGYALLTVAEALRQRASFERRAPNYAGYVEPKPRDRRIQRGWFHAGWLPFASFYSDLVMLVDASPTKAGKPGQIIAFQHDPDKIVYVAPSFTALLRASITWMRDAEDDVLG